LTGVRHPVDSQRSDRRQLLCQLSAVRQNYADSDRHRQVRPFAHERASKLQISATPAVLRFVEFLAANIRPPDVLEGRSSRLGRVGEVKLSDPYRVRNGRGADAR